MGFEHRSFSKQTLNRPPFFGITRRCVTAQIKVSTNTPNSSPTLSIHPPKPAPSTHSSARKMVGSPPAGHSNRPPTATRQPSASCPLHHLPNPGLCRRSINLLRLRLCPGARGLRRAACFHTQSPSATGVKAPAASQCRLLSRILIPTLRVPDLHNILKSHQTFRQMFLVAPEGARREERHVAYPRYVRWDVGPSSPTQI